jgi:predicted HTH transcriptional regulator
VPQPLYPVRNLIVTWNQDKIASLSRFPASHLLVEASSLTGKPEREERWEYPLEALREMVINSIVHRDYASSSDSIVKIYEDRIEIFNPGRLPDGLSVERLLAGDYVSSIRNRKMADMFKEVGLIEKYGTGIRRCENCSEYLLDDSVMKRTEEILDKVDSSAELEIIRYAA